MHTSYWHDTEVGGFTAPDSHLAKFSTYNQINANRQDRLASQDSRQDDREPLLRGANYLAQVIDAFFRLHFKVTTVPSSPTLTRKICCGILKAVNRFCAARCNSGGRASLQRHLVEIRLGRHFPDYQHPTNFALLVAQSKVFS